MARDEIGAIRLAEFQSEVLAGNLYPEKGEDPFDDGPVYDETVVAEAWRWCIENDQNPRHVENSLMRYSTNFSPAMGGEPLALGNEPPEAVQDDHPEFEVPAEWKRGEADE